MPHGEPRRQLRSRIRRRRRALERATRIHAERAITRAIRQLPVYRRAARVAAYLSIDAEPSLETLIRAAMLSGKQVFLPVVRGANMRFARFSPRVPLRRNRLGILEPRRAPTIDGRCLDLVLTPLIAFDDRGVRLGFGRGYYDRCFRYLASRSAWRKPKLLGVGFEFQRLAHIDSAPWDVRLWGAVTETATYRFAEEAACATG